MDLKVPKYSIITGSWHVWLQNIKYDTVIMTLHELQGNSYKDQTES